MTNADQWADDDGLEGAPRLGGCQADGLTALLNTVVAQLTEAERRQSDSFATIQDRLEHRLEDLQRDAEALRGSVPSDLNSAIDRIEAALALLSERLSNEAASDAQQGSATVEIPTTTSATAAFAPSSEAANAGDAFASAGPVRYTATSQSGVEQSAKDVAPFALRSAVPADYSLQASSRITGPIDHFDVIESMGSSDHDPWDRDSADALSNLYDPVTTPDAAVAAPVKRAASGDAAAVAAMPVADGVDKAWIEQRFAEIAERLEASLNDIRPDEGFFALGQRIDGLELQITQAVEAIQDRGGNDNLEIVESHIGELAGYLEGTNQQLGRLEAIEAQLAAVAERIDEVHAIARGAAEGGSPAAADFDIEALARAAALEVGNQFSAQSASMPDIATNELRDTLTAFMGERRQGDEALAATLDTLQQAVARLLDRVEGMSLAPNAGPDFDVAPGYAESAREAYHPQAVPEPEFAEYNPGASNVSDIPYSTSRVERRPAPKDAPHFEGEQDQGYAEDASGQRADFRHSADMRAEADDYATTEAMEAPVRRAEHDVKTAAEMRQDFIADARRAKMRLAAEANDMSPDMSAPMMSEAVSSEPMADMPVAARNLSDIRNQLRKNEPSSPAEAARPDPRRRAEIPQVAAAKGAAAPSQRLVVLGLGALVALGGLWYSLDQPAPRIGTVEKAAVGGGTRSIAPEASAQTGAKAPAAALDGDASTPEPAHEPAGDGEAAPAMNDFETRGEIIPGDVIGGETSVALPGISVDAESTPSPEELASISRRQAMANMSTSLGRAAAKIVNEVPTPTTIAPPMPNAEPASHSPTLPKSQSMQTTSQLDMPPAAIGPLSLRLAAANGDPSAEFNVGARFAEGSGVKQDFNEAARWYQRSAARGFAQAQYRLGTLFERGLGVRADAKKAVNWYEAAAAQGNIKAMHNLAVMKANSNDGTPDYMAAASLFERAAQYGLSDSQFNLAILYENGLGVGKDLRVAYKWLALAARSGDAETQNRRDMLKGRLSRQELTEAERMIAGFRPKMRDRLINDARAAGDAWKRSSAS